MASISNLSEDDALLRARVLDACHLCELRSYPRFVGFLDEHRQAVVRALLHEKGQTHHLFFGGCEGAGRVMLGVFPDFLDPDPSAFPITAIRFTYRESAQLTHRDFLGTLMAAGIKRDVLGDIVCECGSTVVFVAEEMAAFIASSVTKVGGEGVRVDCPYEGEVTIRQTFSELSDTVASPRLDAVLRAALRVSREEAARRIEAGLVSVNHLPCLSVSAEIKVGDTLSVRGSGRFLVDAVGPKTKKGRWIVQIRRYE